MLTVPTQFLSHPVVDLLVDTESINEQEKQEWLDLLPKMTDVQIKQLETIFLTEEAKLSELKAIYEKENIEKLLAESVWKEKQARKELQDLVMWKSSLGFSMHGAKMEYEYLVTEIISWEKLGKITSGKAVVLMVDAAYAIFSSATQTITQDERNEILESLGLLEAFAQYYQDKEESNREDHRDE